LKGFKAANASCWLTKKELEAESRTSNSTFLLVPRPYESDDLPHVPSTVFNPIDDQ
jgi:hypothetical protein